MLNYLQKSLCDYHNNFSNKEIQNLQYDIPGIRIIFYFTNLKFRNERFSDEICAKLQKKKIQLKIEDGIGREEKPNQWAEYQVHVEIKIYGPGLSLFINGQQIILSWIRRKETKCSSFSATCPVSFSPPKIPIFYTIHSSTIHFLKSKILIKPKWRQYVTER